MANQADLVVSNGSLGTAIRTLLAGTPLLMLPLYLEHRITAQRIADLGAGLLLAPSNVDAMEHAVNRLLTDAAFTSGAESIRKKYEEHHTGATVDRVVGRILDLL